MAESKGTILVVDDEMLNRTLLSTNLKGAGYTVSTAEDGEQALLGLRNEPFDVVLLDLMMPGMDGFQVLEQMKADNALRGVPVIVVSAEEDAQSVVRCIEMGAVDHLPKPFDPVLLHARINSALATKRLYDQQANYRKDLEKRVWEQTQSLQKSYEQLQTALNGTVFALSSVVELRDPYTAGHQQRVTHLACAIAREMGLTDDRIEGIRVSGLLHDIGKICVPAEILAKPGRIADIEFNIIKIHPQVGYEILKNVEFPWPVADIVAQHHEALDGSGYPKGIAGDDVLLESRIIMVADIIEAMATHRPYRPSLGMEVAMGEIQKGRGTRYDAAVVDVCETLLLEKGYELESPAAHPR
ncbi:MAG: response regulator [Armatimonadetes bacterium]|nr:response regulator [Armatimonadota bacterium]PIU60691.1 MAG: two-component system response regulator [Armatimonadetes bacterium CG07_land_8_20_14_0_80_59_28]PIX38824.1 MAG: two-component system response regulator [Armatimonadetes bacterium CG_4_8_14_3_um_filter_58_9]PIY46163.1 MAG: two-component system response regulator [Armatimonadetes bacterium CG_4_10_14_3_um_filter_59_10]